MVCATVGKVSTSAIALSYEDVVVLSLPEFRMSLDASLLEEGTQQQSPRKANHTAAGSRLQVSIG
jgi:hypothetical protein